MEHFIAQPLCVLVLAGTAEKQTSAGPLEDVRVSVGQKPLGFCRCGPASADAALAETVFPAPIPDCLLSFQEVSFSEPVTLGLVPSRAERLETGATDPRGADVWGQATGWTTAGRQVSRSRLLSL